MKKIRVLLANSRPRIMRQVMRQLIERQPDMEIIGEVAALSDLIRIAKETAADVIIITLEDVEASGLGRQLLAECADVTILALASKGDTAFIERLSFGRREIVDPSEVNILSALRQAIQAEPNSMHNDSMHNERPSMLQPSEANNDRSGDQGQHQEGHCQRQ
jgi:DNA-binding NarL/FixJ family response regulator